MKRILFNLAIILLCFRAPAQGPPILTGTPVMLGLEGNGIRTFGKYIAKEDVSIYLQPIAIPYNITPKFQVGGILPFKYLKPRGAKAAAGFADASLFAKYQLYKKDGRAKTFRILGKVQHSFPTGNTLSSPPIGAGIHQTLFGLIAGRISPAIGIYGDFSYVLTGGGATDRLLYNFALSVPLLPQQYPQKQINTLLEFNGSYLLDPQTHSLFISPGLQFIPGRRILFEASLQMPLQQPTEASNKTRYMLLAGTRFLLN